MGAELLAAVVANKRLGPHALGNGRRALAGFRSIGIGSCLGGLQFLKRLVLIILEPIEGLLHCNEPMSALPSTTVLTRYSHPPPFLRASWARSSSKPISCKRLRSPLDMVTIFEGKLSVWNQVAMIWVFQTV